MNKKINELVQEYYGKIISGTKDLKTSSCCNPKDFPVNIKKILHHIPKEIHEKFYGCGSPIPEEIEGRTILDLGCGTGRDVYVMSALAGEKGKVIGVDMTEEQLQVAMKYQSALAEKYGFAQSNVSFRHGYIEDLQKVEIADHSVDIVTSNCVINLSPAKEQVFAEIFRVLKEGGELYFSDIFADRRIPEDYLQDQELLGECLSGAMYIEDFRRLLSKFEIPDYRVVSCTPIRLTNPKIKRKIGHIHFYSMTIRVFNIKGLEDRCEDYGQAVIYKGTIDGANTVYALDMYHRFYTGKITPVCRNTARLLHESRLASHFEVQGEGDTHYGLFDCVNQHKVESGEGESCDC